MNRDGGILVKPELGTVTNKKMTLKTPWSCRFKGVSLLGVQ